MNPSDFADIRRELLLHDLLLHYLQDEQKKRWEELHEVQKQHEELNTLIQTQAEEVRELIQKNEKLMQDPRVKELVQLLLKMKTKETAGPRSRAKRAERGGDTRLRN